MQYNIHFVAHQKVLMKDPLVLAEGDSEFLVKGRDLCEQDDKEPKKVSINALKLGALGTNTSTVTIPWITPGYQSWALGEHRTHENRFLPFWSCSGTP